LKQQSLHLLIPHSWLHPSLISQHRSTELTIEKATKQKWKEWVTDPWINTRHEWTRHRELTVSFKDISRKSELMTEHNQTQPRALLHPLIPFLPIQESTAENRKRIDKQSESKQQSLQLLYPQQLHEPFIHLPAPKHRVDKQKSIKTEAKSMSF
jgi:hypothetical protein